MARCDYCGKEVAFPFKCKYCGGLFCIEHHLPEKHECKGLTRGEKGEYLYLYPYSEEKQSSSHTFTFKEKITEKLSSITILKLDELVDFTIATLAIYVVYLGLFGWKITSKLALILFAFSVLTYVPHELAHKLTAQYYGFRARYKLFKEGLLMTLISSFLPIKIISPGSVLISGFPDKRALGIIALSGPLTNITMAALASQIRIFGILTGYFIQINLWIALFNLIPFGVLDGKKVVEWSFTVWLICFFFTITLFLL